MRWSLVKDGQTCGKTRVRKQFLKHKHYLFYKLSSLISTVISRQRQNCKLYKRQSITDTSVSIPSVTSSPIKPSVLCFNARKTLQLYPLLIRAPSSGDMAKLKRRHTDQYLLIIQNSSASTSDYTIQFTEDFSFSFTET